MPATPTTARAWLDHVLAPGWTLLFDQVTSPDPLSWPDYPALLAAACDRTGASESVLVGHGRLADRTDAVVIAFEFGFLGGSMGVAAGERICRAFEHAAERDLPVLALVATGGARMQEGMHALAQMAATTSARAAFAATGRPFIAYLRSPTTGGVYASFASTADVVWAEPGATVAFAGARVAEAITGEPDDAPRSAEHARDVGLVDDVVAPDDLVEHLRALLAPDDPVPATRPDEPARPDAGAMDQVRRARDPDRGKVDPVPDLLPLRSSTSSIRCGIARIAGRGVVTIAMDPQRAADGRGATASPRSYRDARHAIEIAGRLGLPIVTFVDTPGADPRASAETEGIARELALTFDALLAAPVPTVACIIGEGGSGGALALAACDRVLIQRDAIFSVLAPEGAAAILRRDDVGGVASSLKPTAHDLREQGLADLVVDEPPGGAGTDPEASRDALHAAIAWALDDVTSEGAPTPRRRTRWRSAMEGR